jgi:hypothetical protein
MGVLGPIEQEGPKESGSSAGQQYEGRFTDAPLEQ